MGSTRRPETTQEFSPHCVRLMTPENDGIRSSGLVAARHYYHLVALLLACAYAKAGQGIDYHMTRTEGESIPCMEFCWEKRRRTTTLGRRVARRATCTEFGRRRTPGLIRFLSSIPPDVYNGRRCPLSNGRHDKWPGPHRLVLYCRS